ncbi:Uncharacterised protein [uncultured archaeon]|nr:Uncharacterised protein [uncultured archaeon]
MDRQYKLSEISKMRKLNDFEYEYEIYIENISKPRAYSNLGSKICIKDKGVSGVPYITNIILEKLSREIRSRIICDSCIVFIENISPSDTIRIITDRNMDNYDVQFPEAKIGAA